jgi:Thioredoxin-like
LKEKGFELVAVNRADSAEVINRYVDKNKFTFRIVMGGSDARYAVGEAYGVMAYPTNYLVGADGTVLWRGIGFNEGVIRQALAKAAVE